MNRRTTALLCLATILVAVLGSGCETARRWLGRDTTTTTSTTTTTTSAGQPSIKELKVLGTGFTQSEGGVISVGVLLENTSKEKTAESVSVRVEILDKNKKVLGQRIEEIAVFPQASRMGIGMTIPLLDESNPVSSVRAKIDKAGFVSLETPQITSNEVTVSQSDTSTVVTGSAKSPFSKELKNLKVYVIVMDEKDAIVGGGVSVIDVLPAKGTAPFEVDLIARTPLAKKAQAYYALDNLSLILPANIR